jgi:hypothetical protein
MDAVITITSGQGQADLTTLGLDNLSPDRLAALEAVPLRCQRAASALSR